MFVKSTPKKASWLTLRLILSLVLFLGLLFIFVAITDEIVLEHENNFDQFISQKMSLLVSPFTTKVMEAITFFGSSTFLFPAYIVLCIYFLFRKNKQMVVDIAMVGATSTGILFLFKNIFKRHRPLDPLIQNVTGFSYPSGHSFSSFTFFGLLIYIVWATTISKALKILLSVLLFLAATVIAFSRVYLRVHFPSDVIAGFCLSLVWLMLSLYILHKLDKKSGNVLQPHS